MDDRLAAGEEGEERVFWAAVSWLEAERSRKKSSDEVSRGSITAGAYCSRGLMCNAPAG